MQIFYQLILILQHNFLRMNYSYTGNKMQRPQIVISSWLSITYSPETECQVYLMKNYYFFFISLWQWVAVAHTPLPPTPVQHFVLAQPFFPRILNDTVHPSSLRSSTSPPPALSSTSEEDLLMNSKMQGKSRSCLHFC